MGRDAFSPGTSAPYGQACANCSRSKCKCIIRSAGQSCGRCSRLEITCRPAASVRRRNPRKPALSKASRLEEKLDSLVSLIKSGASTGAISTPHDGAAVFNDLTPRSDIRMTENTPTYHQLEIASMSSSSNNHVGNASGFTSANDDLTQSTYSLLPSDSRDTTGEPSSDEAEEYLTNFRMYKLKFFPFFHISSAISAQQLRQERPFLWLCIMAVSSKSTLQQQLLGSRVRSTAAQEIVVRLETSMDLLLGLLAFTGWAHHHVSSKPFLAVFTQLAMSLVFKLGLNKPVLSNANTMLPCTKYIKPATPRTMEERRAVLGCFLITSIVSSFLQKTDALQWTPHMDECLQMIDEKKECLNDDILVQQVRLQLFIERMSRDALQSVARDSTRNTREPTPHHAGGLQLYSDLHEVRAQLLARPEIDESILLHLHSVCVETALSATIADTNWTTPQQRQSLNAGLEAIMSWVEVLFTMDLATYINTSFSNITQLVRCVRYLIIIHPLTTFGDPSWDENGVWKTVDPLLIVDRIINNLEQVAVLANLDNNSNPGGDVFSQGAELLRSLRPGLPDDPSLAVDFFSDDWLMGFLPFPVGHH